MQFFKEIKDVAMAHQFIVAVGSLNLAFSMKPFTTDVNELLQFMETVHNGSYAGNNAWQCGICHNKMLNMISIACNILGFL